MCLKKKEPVVIDCQMQVVCAQWNHDGSVLAIGGIQVVEDKESNLVQFFNPWGHVNINKNMRINEEILLRFIILENYLFFHILSI